MSLISGLYTQCQYKIGTFLDTKHWQYRVVAVAIVCMLLSFLHNASPLLSFKEYYNDVFVKKGEFFLYGTIVDRASDLTANFDYPAYSGAESRVFRLTLPVFVKLFHIKKVSITLYALQLILGVVFLKMVTAFVYKLLNDKEATFYAIVGFTTVYVGTAFFIDFASYGDLYSFFFLFLAIHFRKNPILVFIFITMAAWNDERAFVGSGLVFLWNNFIDDIEQRKPIRIKLNLSGVAIILAWVGFVALRLYLQNVVGMKATYNPDGEFGQRVMQSLPSFGFRLFWQFEGWWLLFLLMTIGLITQKRYITLSLIVLAAMASMLGAMIIYDSTRSGSFAYIAIFFALYFAKEFTTTKQLRLILFIVALLCLLHPLANKTHGVGFFLM